MVEQEIKETVMISIAAILLASLLGFVSFLMVLRSDFATVRNSEVSSANAMANFREFNKYNGSTTLYGEDLVAAIRDYYDSGIRIRVNDTNGNLLYYVDKYVVKDPDPTKKVSVDLAYLQGLFMQNVTPRDTFKPILVYGQVDLATVTKTNSVSSGFDTNVSAVVFFRSR